MRAEDEAKKTTNHLLLTSRKKKKKTQKKKKKQEIQGGTVIFFKVEILIHIKKAKDELKTLIPGTNFNSYTLILSKRSLNTS